MASQSEPASSASFGEWGKGVKGPKCVLAPDRSMTRGEIVELGKLDDERTTSRGKKVDSARGRRYGIDRGEKGLRAEARSSAFHLDLEGTPPLLSIAARVN